MIGLRRFFNALAVVLTVVYALFGASGMTDAEAADGGGGPPPLGLPLVCEPGRTCWLVNHVDHDPGPGMRDYLCGAHGYDGHTGVDFAIRDYSKMDDGVPVVAAAAGPVLRLRDGMLDGDVGLVGKAAVAGRGCGNSVAIGHDGGWETYYCHMRRGSLTVRPGQRVEQGDKLGFVGSSGLAEFPHVHLGVRHNGRFLDPFVGQSRSSECGAGARPFWDATTLARLQGPMTALYDAGFAPTEVNAVALRRGFYRDTELSAKSPVLIFWVDAFWVQEGDVLTMTVTDPRGHKMVDKALPVKKTQARHMRFVGKRKSVDWHEGRYTGVAVLERKTKSGGTETFRIERAMDIK